MANYCSLTEIKKRLVLDDSETSYDQELVDLRAEIQAEIDNALQNYTTVPLTTVPTMIASICAELVEIDYKIRLAPNAEAAGTLKTRRQLALEKLQRYIDETYTADEELPFKVAEA